MIDETLYSVLNVDEANRLGEYEEKVFQYLDTNRITLQSKLQKQEYQRPKKEQRLKVYMAGHEKKIEEERKH